jgi:membrane fusion protein (multidrug efflux system)
MKRFVLLILIAGLAGGGYYGYRNFRPAWQPTQARAARPPQAGRAGRGRQIEVMTVNEEVEALGTLAADESVIIAPEIAGRVIALGFKEGERVRRARSWSSSIRRSSTPNSSSCRPI